MDNGAMIRRVRYALGYKQTELAKAIGISSQCLNYIESGRNAPSSKTMAKFWKFVDEKGLRDIAEKRGGNPAIMHVYETLPPEKRGIVDALIKSFAAEYLLDNDNKE